MLHSTTSNSYTKENQAGPIPWDASDLLLDTGLGSGHARVMPAARTCAAELPLAGTDAHTSEMRPLYSNLDLGPLSDPPEMDTEAHLRQVVCLLTTLWWLWRARPDRYVASDMSIYYPALLAAGQALQKKLEFRGPDFFIIFDPIHKPYRRSWVVENEGYKYPQAIVEVLSDSTEDKDRGEKKAIYQDVFATPEYFLVGPECGTLEGFRLVNGIYRPIAPNEHGHLWSEKLEMALGQVRLPKLGMTMARFFTAKGEMIPDPPEMALRAMEEAKKARRDRARAKRDKAHAEARAAQAESRAKQAETRAEQAETANAQLLAKLQTLGIDLRQLGM